MTDLTILAAILLVAAAPIALVLLSIGALNTISSYLAEALEDNTVHETRRPDRHIDEDHYRKIQTDPFFQDGYRARDNKLPRTLAIFIDNKLERELWLTGWDLSDQDSEALSVIGDLQTEQDEDTHTIITPNFGGYAPYGAKTPHIEMTLKVDAILDCVPGTFFTPQDLMNHIIQNPYVRAVRLDLHENGELVERRYEIGAQEELDRLEAKQLAEAMRS